MYFKKPYKINKIGQQKRIKTTQELGFINKILFIIKGLILLYIQYDINNSEPNDF